MKLATLAAVFSVAALLFFSFGCAGKGQIAPGGNQSPAPPSDIPQPPSTSGGPTPAQPNVPPAPPPAAPPSPPGGDAPPPAPI